MRVKVNASVVDAPRWATAPFTTTRSWIADEPDVAAGLRQAGSVISRGMSRLWHTLAAAAALGLVTAGGAVLMAPPHAPAYVLRAVETDRDPGSMPRPRRELGQYVLDAVFTSSALLQIMDRHHLYARLRRVSPRDALDAFREDVDVEVYENFFLEERTADDPPRSVRVVVRYRSDDAATALLVTRDLGALIVERERASRTMQAAGAVREAGRELAQLKRAAAERTREIAGKRREIANSSAADPTREVELVGLTGSLAALELAVTAAEKRKVQLELGAAYERSGAGFRFEVVDEGSVASSDRLSVAQLVGVGLATLCFGLPLAALAVGAFEPKGGQA